MKRLLVTTALAETLDHSRSIVFLGEWCRLFRNREVLSATDNIVHPYHWDDRKKYRRDYIYLSELYEKKLLQLSKALGEMHGVSQEVRYWRIIVGPWLRFFSDAIYDRYEQIRFLLDSGIAQDSVVMRYNMSDFVPFNFEDFYSQFRVDDTWNHVVFAECLKEFGVLKLIEQGKISPQGKPLLNKRIPISANKLIEYGCRCFPQALNRVVFVSSYISWYRLVRLQLELLQLPYLRAPILYSKRVQVDMEKRRSLVSGRSIGLFEAFLDRMIQQWIPLVYVESFDSFRKMTLEQFPSSPEVIFTANAYQADDGFKIWAAHHVVERGVQLVIGQHGGNFGIALFNQTEDHQIAIADVFASWGWSDSSRPTVQALSAMKASGLGARADVCGDILLTAASLPRYFYCQYAIPIAGQSLRYLQDQIQFIEELSPEIRHLVHIRMDTDVFGWDLLARLREAGIKGSIEEIKEPFGERLKRCRLHIATTNTTVFLETLAANFPTLVFFDTELFEIRSQARDDIEALRSVSIFHDTPMAAAKFLNGIGNDISAWWNDYGVQQVRKEFCNRYARCSPDWAGEWKRLFRSLQVSANRADGFEPFGGGKVI